MYAMTFSDIFNFVSPGFSQAQAKRIQTTHDALLNTHPDLTPEQQWQHLKPLLFQENIPFHVYHAIFTLFFPRWPDAPDAAPVWVPDETTLKNAPIAKYMRKHRLNTVADCHAFSIHPDQAFWQTMIDDCHLIFKTPPTRIVDLSQGKTEPKWFPGAALNIADSCFQAPKTTTAIIEQDSHGHQKHHTYDALDRLSNRVANGLVTLGYRPQDRLAIIMPMTAHAVAIYLGIIKMGGTVVTIADSFSSEEIATRLQLSRTKAVFTQDQFLRNGRCIPLYPRIKTATKMPVIVLPHTETFALPLQPEDIAWPTFLSNIDTFASVACRPMDAIHILFSSGTTGTPKAIAWNHTTPIKVASDAMFHQGITKDDVLCWPTNLGWMMGPWLVFATLIHGARMALYTEAPKSREFGQFIEQAHVTMLGVVPTLVATWRESRCMEGLHWSSIRAFSSTGECSNPEDMFYLMWLGHDKPIIEYCGGTEIGGAYLSSTLLQPNYPALFSTPAMGNRVGALNPEGKLSDNGEVCLFPPALGLSVTLENANHFDVYYKDMPVYDGTPLRRHGDELKKVANGYFSIQGRVDDAMNLGGIKVSAAEIERALIGIPGIKETAAIAITPKGQGFNSLIIYATPTKAHDKTALMKEMQARINTHLNPLFKIHDLVFMDELPKTASNKIMRKTLRINHSA
jgi:acetyl-CoA synthetase